MRWSREAERHGEGPWHASGAARGLLQVLGWPKLLRFPRLTRVLIYLIYSKKRHVAFCHLLAIVVDFLKIGKVELPVSEKGGKPPRKHSFVVGLLPETPLFLPSSAWILHRASKCRSSACTYLHGSNCIERSAKITQKVSE